MSCHTSLATEPWNITCLPSVCPKCGQLGHKATRCLGLPPIPISKVSQFSAAKVISGTQDQLMESTISTDTVPEKIDAAFQSLKAIESALGSKDVQILLTLILRPKETALVSALDTDVFVEKEIPTSTVMGLMATSSSEEIFEQVDVSKPVDSSTHSLPQTSDATLGEVDNVVDNTFTSPTSVPFFHNNLFAVLDYAEASEPPAVSQAKELVFINSPLPSSASAPHNTAPGQSRDLEESTQRSRGGRPLKPSQRHGMVHSSSQRKKG
ncbi:hypothetical protein F2Q70_00007536 [Brassica cretica]|uniref:CCHC-type domain-containing protein n=1 Tax=Brassica cretica TaxID=69181 RepID=A0A8S9JCZ1_BRACR|nr:hypothetical protein F2Q68_00000589 [Brassica cretica]KAF2613944.1 hypothetical protein F2Q70_00007536 [Brassica cretica]